MSWRLFFLLLLLPGCSSVREVPFLFEADNLSSENSLSPDRSMLQDRTMRDRSEAIRSVLVGQLQVKKDNYGQALESFNRARTLMADAPPPLLLKQIAELLVREGKLDRALSEIDAGLQQSPADRDLLIFKAGVLESLNRIDESEVILRGLIRKDSSDSTAKVLLSSLLVGQGKTTDAVASLKDEGNQSASGTMVTQVYLARALEAAGERKEAMDVLRNAVKKNPDNAGLRFELGRLFLAEKQNAAGKRELELVLQRDPTHVGARKLLGLLSLQEKDFAEARSHLETLESLEPDPTDTRFHLALLEIEERNFSSALRELSLVLATKPEHAEARYALATVLMSTSRKEEALSELEKIPEESSLFPRARAVRFALFREEGKLSEAEVEIAKAYRQDESNSIFLLPYISILRDQGKFSEALVVLEEHLDEGKQADSQLLFLYGLTLEEAGEEEKALAVMEQVAERDPNNPAAGNFIAYALVQRNQDLDRAEKLVTKALSSKPQDPYFLDTFGWLRFRQGRFSDAALILKQASELAPEEVTILEHCADAYAALGDTTEAVKLLDRAIKLAEKENEALAHRLQEKREGLLR